MKQESTRVAFTTALLDLAAADDRIVLVSSDSLKVVRADPFLQRYPERVFEVGIAEQNAVDVAAGLAAGGLIPFFATYAGFITMRACEQVRTFVAYPGLNVKLVGANGGMAGGEREGVTHQFIEDLGIMRTIPGITVVAPADAAGVRAAVQAVARRPGPAYIRIGSGRDPVVFETEEGWELGKIRVLAAHGDDLAVFVYGYMVTRTLDAAALLAAQGVRVTVIEVHTLKPLDDEAVAGWLARTGAAVTVEDHNVIGGLGSAIAELSSSRYPVPVVRLGLQDRYPESGDAEVLLDHYGLSAADLCAGARRALALKKECFR